MGFQIYTGVRTRTKQYISITESRTFGIPRPFLTEQGIEAGVKVVLLYDPEKHQIGLKFSDKKPKFGYALRLSKNPRHGGSIIAKSFFDDMKIDAKKYAGHYEFEKMPVESLGLQGGDGDAYIINLNRQKANVRPGADLEPDGFESDGSGRDDTNPEF